MTKEIDTKFPFGKHQGTELSEVPKEYLTWCLKDIGVNEYSRRRNRGFFDLIEQEIEKR